MVARWRLLDQATFLRLRTTGDGATGNRSSVCGAIALPFCDFGIAPRKRWAGGASSLGSAFGRKQHFVVRPGSNAEWRGAQVPGRKPATTAIGARF
jgi:hypothetical protein